MKSDKQRITEALMVLSAEFPNVSLTQANYKAYLLVLEDLPAEMVEKACQELAGSNREFYPPAGVIRQTAFNLQDAAEDTPSALEAWGQVKGSIPGKHELTDKAMQALGGWRAWGQSNIDDEPSWRARFIQAYEILQRREQEQKRRLPEVAGYIEAQKAQLVDNEIRKLLDGKRINSPDDTIEGEMPY